jgi:hypothetical protein
MPVKIRIPKIIGTVFFTLFTCSSLSPKFTSPKFLLNLIIIYNHNSGYGEFSTREKGMLFLSIISKKGEPPLLLFVPKFSGND